MQSITEPIAIAVRLANASQQQPQPVAFEFSVVGVGGVAVPLALHVGLAVALAHALAAFDIPQPVEQSIVKSLEQDAALVGAVDVAVAQFPIGIVTFARLGAIPPPALQFRWIAFGHVTTGFRLGRTHRRRPR